MKFLEQFYTSSNDGYRSVNATQGSTFAKQVAGDFNPIHHADSKRFCVPGDLLFALALEQYGLHRNMAFEFLDLVNADTLLNYPTVSTDGKFIQLQVVNDKKRPVLGLECGGGSTMESARIEQLLKAYVAFSGHNFPHILVPLMQEHKVMINPARPLVIYKSMSFELETLNFDHLAVALEATSLEVEGKRGNAKLNFSLSDDGKVIGHGRKKLVLSGLREYEEASIQAMCEEYLASKSH